MFLYVTNKNDFVHQDRFDGVDYFFEPHKPEVVPAEAAAHMFGFNKKDKTETLVRLGWANDPSKVKVLAKFVISEAVFQPPVEEKQEVKKEDKKPAEPVSAAPVHQPSFIQHRGPGEAPRAEPAR